MQLSESQKKLGEQLVKFPMRFCGACFIGDPLDQSSKVNSGTMTFVKNKGERYGITNFHVVEEYRLRREKEENIRFGVGAIEIDLESTLFDEDKDLDLCVLFLEGYKESDFKCYGDVPVNFFDIYDLGKVLPKPGEMVLFGGYPGAFRQRIKSRELAFETLSSGGTEVNDVTNRSIRFELALNRCEITGSRSREEIPENLGGLSGGPVFMEAPSDGGISTFHLVGIIYEQMTEYDSILARPVTFLDERLWISK